MILNGCISAQGVRSIALKSLSMHFGEKLINSMPKFEKLSMNVGMIGT
jgi:hypothetical protein